MQRSRPQSLTNFLSAPPQKGAFVPNSAPVAQQFLQNNPNVGYLFRNAEPRSAPNSPGPHSANQEFLDSPYSAMTPMSPHSPHGAQKKTRRRPRNSQQHNEEEHRRRARLREQFTALKDASGCEKKDRFSILCNAVQCIDSLKSRVARLEAERAKYVEKYGSSEEKLHLQQMIHNEEQRRSSFNMAAIPTPDLLHGMNSGDNDQLFMSHVPMAITTLDAHFVNCNPEFAELTGFPKEVLLQRSIFSLTHRDCLREACSLVQTLLAEKYEPQTFERYFKWLRQDNSVVNVRVIISTISRNTNNNNSPVLSHFVFIAAPLSDEPPKLEEPSSRAREDTPNNTGIQNVATQDPESIFMPDFKVENPAFQVKQEPFVGSLGLNGMNIDDQSESDITVALSPETDNSSGVQEIPFGNPLPLGLNNQFPSSQSLDDMLQFR